MKKFTIHQANSHELHARNAEIFRRLVAGEPVKTLARKEGLDKSSVKGAFWAHVNHHSDLANIIDDAWEEGNGIEFIADAAALFREKGIKQ